MLITLICALIVGAACFMTGSILSERKVDKHKVTKRYLNLSPESRKMIDGHFIAREVYDARKKNSETSRISKWDC